MGASGGDFHKYPRTPHLFGSRGTDDDKHLSERESLRLLADDSLIVEEKLDGTNVGIHFTEQGELVLQCRGHIITEGMHPQYDLFKQWVSVKRDRMAANLQDRYILYGEWLYARHTIHYRALPHYFFEFDVFDKREERFLELESRQSLVDALGIQTVPVVHRGKLNRKTLESLISRSAFDSQFVHPETGHTDDLMEGLYLRTEKEGCVSARAKFVRPEFTEKVKQSDHWQYQKMTTNKLAEGRDIWSGGQ